MTRIQNPSSINSNRICICSSKLLNQNIFQATFYIRYLEHQYKGCKAGRILSDIRIQIRVYFPRGSDPDPVFFSWRVGSEASQLFLLHDHLSENVGRPSETGISGLIAHCLGKERKKEIKRK